MHVVRLSSFAASIACLMSSCFSSEASSFAWHGKPFVEAFVDSDVPFAMQELVTEVKQVRLNVTLSTIIC